MATTVMRYAAISARGEIEHLVFERIRGQRPAVAEDHWLPGAPVLVVNLRSVFGRKRTHGALSFGWVGGGRGVRLLGSCSRHGCWQACGSGNTGATDRNRRRDVEASAPRAARKLSNVSGLMVGIISALEQGGQTPVWFIRGRPVPGATGPAAANPVRGVWEG